MLLCDLPIDVLSQILDYSTLVDILLLGMTGNRRLLSRLSHGGVRKLIFATKHDDDYAEMSQLWAKCLEGSALHQVSYSYGEPFCDEDRDGHNWLKKLQNCLKVLELDFPYPSALIAVFPSYVAKEEEDEEEEEKDEPSPYVTLDAEEGETVAKMASRLGMDIAKGNAFYRLSKAENVSAEKPEKLWILRNLDDGSLEDNVDSIRTTIGIDGTSKKCELNPNLIPDCHELFVQSTSPNRKLSAGPVIVRVASEVNQVIDEDEDMPVIKRSMHKKRVHKSLENEVEEMDGEIGTGTSKRMKLVESSDEWSLAKAFPSLVRLLIGQSLRWQEAAPTHLPTSVLPTLPASLTSLKLRGGIHFTGTFPSLDPLLPNLVDFHLGRLTFDILQKLPSTLCHLTFESMSDWSKITPSIWPTGLLSLTYFCNNENDLSGILILVCLPRHVEALSILEPDPFHHTRIDEGLVLDNDDDEDDAEMIAKEQKKAILAQGKAVFDKWDSDNWSVIKNSMVSNTMARTKAGPSKEDYDIAFDKGLLYGLPVGLKSLDLTALEIGYMSVYLLPPTLTYARMELTDSMITKMNFWQFLPPSLTELRIHSSLGNSCGTTAPKKWAVFSGDPLKSPLRNHPNLVSLEISGLTGSIPIASYLPRNLQNLYLRVADAMFGEDWKNFPSTLKRLEIDCPKSYTGDYSGECWVSYLPRGLKHLHNRVSYDHFIFTVLLFSHLKDLPPTLETFTSAVGRDENMKNMFDYEWNENIMNALPSSVRRFTLLTLLQDPQHYLRLETLFIRSSVNTIVQ